MKLNRRTQRYLQIENVIYTVLLLAVMALLAWLSMLYPLQSDWTFNGRNTLTESSRKLLAHIEDDIQITAFISQDATTVQNAILNLISRYQRYKSNIQLEFINPQTNPGQARALGVTRANEVLIHYKNREQRLQTLSEEILSNALQRLAREDVFQVAFLSGHGERDPYGHANYDLSVFSRHLQEKGYEVQNLNLATHPTIPDNTHILLLADPRTSLMEGEIKIIEDYLGKGGNLLWLHEPNQPTPSNHLNAVLGIKFLPGVVVDATAQQLKVPVDFALVSKYSDHNITQDLRNISLFPQAAGIERHNDYAGAFTYTTLLQTSTSSWTETGAIQGKIRFDINTKERAGPITIGACLSKDEQRIVILGDSDFLSNAYLGNGGNLELGLRITDWLSHQDKLLTINPITAPDTQLQLKESTLILLALLFLILLPMMLIGTGIAIAWKRHRQ